MEKPQIVVLNKIDLTGTNEAGRAFQAAVKDREVLQISAVTRKGVDKLTSMMIKYIEDYTQDQSNGTEP
jgi:GTP-binding protein